MVWEIVFMLVILKIPIVYLCSVIWYAIHAESAPTDPAASVPVADTPPSGGSPWRPRRGGTRLPRRPSPARRPAGAQRTPSRASVQR
jgi:hypothetical protein